MPDAAIDAVLLALLLLAVANVHEEAVVAAAADSPGTAPEVEQHAGGDAGAAGSDSEEMAVRAAGASHCKILFTSGYGYKQFFPVSDAVRHAGRDDDDPLAGWHGVPQPAPPAPAPPTPSPAAAANATAPAAPHEQRASKRLVLRFQVMAESNAHILMSAQRRSDREAYEVVLGAGANSYVDFRCLPASIPPKRAFNYSVGVVSGTELRAFWLLADLGTGVLAVGPEGGPPILAWVDPEPIQVRYFSLCTWTEVHGTWLYGCDEAGNSQGLDAENMSPSERVLQHVVRDDKKHAPHITTDIDSSLTVDRIVMDDRTGVLSVFGTMLAEWRDDRLTWTPANFSDLNSTLVPQADVWVPALHAVDSVPPAPLFSTTRSRLLVHSSGLLQWRSPVLLQARCSLAAGTAGGEVYSCAVGLATPPPGRIGPITLEPSKKQPQQSEGGWEWCGLAAEMGGGGGDPPRTVWTLRLCVRHRGSRLSSVFLAAFTAACACCLLSLLAPEPRPTRRRATLVAELRMNTLMASLTLLMEAVSLISLQTALPPALLTSAPFGVAVTSLSFGLLLAAVGLLFPLCVSSLLAAPSPYKATTSGAASSARPPARPSSPPALPRPVCKLLRRPTLSRLLLCRREEAKLPLWRESADTPEQTLEMLEEWSVEEARRDWQMLSVVVEKLCNLTCLILLLASCTSILMLEK